MVIVLMYIAVLAGAMVQRATGVGFALISTPFLILALGPAEGVVTVSVLGGLSALLIWVSAIKQVDYRAIVPIIIAAVVGIAPGALLSRVLPGPQLAIAAGSLVVAALVISLFAGRVTGLNSLPGRLGAGFLGGFMQAVCGIGGPAVMAYANAVKWEQRSFAISIQFYFVVICAFTTASLGSAPPLTLLQWIILLAILIVGTIAGALVNRRLSPATGRTIAMILAFLGGITVIVNGVQAL